LIILAGGPPPMREATTNVSLSIERDT